MLVTAHTTISRTNKGNIRAKLDIAHYASRDAEFATVATSLFYQIYQDQLWLLVGNKLFEVVQPDCSSFNDIKNYVRTLLPTAEHTFVEVSDVKIVKMIDVPTEEETEE